MNRMTDDPLKSLIKAIVDFDEDEATRLIQLAIKEEFAPHEILNAVSDALHQVGDLYESHKYYLSELMLCGDTAKTAIALLQPYIAETEMKMLGTVVFGTVEGDIHDIGKTIVSSFMIGAGFKVLDLGVEVTAAKFIKAIKQYKPDIIAMSALLSTTREYMREVVNAVKQAGLRDQVKILVGGRPVTPDFTKAIGADATATNPFEAVEVCKNWLKE